VTSIAVYPKLPFDYKKDYTPVSAFASGTANLLVVNAAYPATTVKELLVLAKNRDKPVTYGSPGIGSVQHFVAELFNMRSAAQLTHVPYKGQAPALTALLANEVNLTFLQPPGGFDLIKNGRLRAIAYAGAERWPAMPNLPTVLESGIDFHIKGPFEGLIAPRGLPRAIVDRLHAEVLRALEAPQLKEFLTASGWEADRRGPREFGEFIVSEVQRYTDIARAVGIKSE